MSTCAYSYQRHGRRRRRSLIVLLALASTLAVVARAGATPPWPTCAQRSAPIRVGARELSRTAVDARLQEVTLASRAMDDTQRVDVLLPRHYDPSGTTSYPVLYLLHGAFGSYHDWADHGVERILGGRRLIVVMPDDGVDGSYSDWYGTVAGHPGPAPAWESYHLRELVPWVDGHYRTIAAARGRAIAGLSSGGGGAMKYAAANPGMFSAAGEFSGAVDIDLPGYPATSGALWDLTYLPGLGPPAHCTWGDPAAHPVIWADNDPTFLASNLRGTALFLASGDGQPGPLDSPAATPDVVESTVWQMNQAFDAALTAREIPHRTDFYGSGTHSWPYWVRDLRKFLPWLAGKLDRRQRAPRPFSVASARVPFSAWGWRFRPHRSVRELTYLTRVGSGGLTAAGSGRLAVRTAALYRPGAGYAVRIGERRRHLRASRRGRLGFVVPLGPTHTSEQTHISATPPRGWRRVTVRIRPIIGGGG